MKKSFIFIATLLCLVFIFNQKTSFSQTPAGISFGAGAGVFVAENKDRYMDIQADLYPEIGMYIDVSGIRAGVTAGFVYRKKEVDYWEWGWYDDYSYEYEYTMMLMPVQAELALLPLRFFNPRSTIQPFASISAGAFIPTGDSDWDENEFCASVKLGGEVYFMDFGVLYGDLRYTYVDKELGGFIATAGVRFRIPFNKRNPRRYYYN